MSGKADISWMIGGPQGSGVDSSATLFARACTAGGYWVFGKREYHSNIKGEHSYFQIRVKTEPVQSNIDPIHLLATFEHSTAEIHAHELVGDGALIYDSKVTNPDDIGMLETVARFPLPYDDILAKIAEETGQNPMKLVIMKNTVAVAASLALLGVPVSAIEDALNGLFSGKKSKLIPLNLTAAKKAYEAIEKLEGFGKFAYKLQPPVNPPAKGSRLVVNGAQMSGMGKLKAGCRVLTYYSITPAVDECIYLEDHPEYGTVVFQCEDELAAVNMAIGAATTGIRSSTATSGPGFSLMAEGMGWAGINEVPVVVFDYQRGGPSTGLPTRNEQGELLFAIHIGHGDYPKIVMTAGDLHECFEMAFYSFNYADRYQLPVICIVDKALANCTQSILPYDESNLVIDRGELVGTDAKFDGDLTKAIGKFPRFAVTESGISPRPLPGTPGHIYWMTGDEHTEYGHITEEPEIRMPMHEKRMRKLDLAAKEIPTPMKYTLYGPESADLTLVSYGAQKGPILDAMKVLQAEHGIKMNYLHLRLMNPFPADEILAILNKAKIVASMESNISGQMAQLIRMRTSFNIQHQILKYTGRPVSETEVVSSVLEVVRQESKKVVLTYGH